MTGDAELQAQIAAMAGQINRHKQQQQQTQGSPPSYQYSHPPYQSAPHRGSYRGSGRWTPYRGGHSTYRAPYKNKSLVVASDQSTPVVGKEDTSPNLDDVLPVSTSTHVMSTTQRRTEGLVKIRGTNNQLMTQAAHERELKARQANVQAHKAVKQKQRNQEEKVKLAEHFQGSSTSRELEVEGVRFRVKDDGSKLIRMSGERPAEIKIDPRVSRLKTLQENLPEKETPRKAVIAGVEFYRTKNGNLIRKGVLKDPKRYHYTFEKIRRQQHSPPVYYSVNDKKQPPQCEHFAKNGTCPFGPACRFTHDPEKVAICKTFLRTGSCPSGEYCDLSHTPTYNRVPACTHFFNGSCKNDACRYPHICVAPAALVCRPFALLGYCDKGADCDKRHVFECPDFANEGECPRFKSGKCILPHVRRAFNERKTVEQQQQESSRNRDDDSELDESESESGAVGALIVNDVDSDDLADDNLMMNGSDDDGHELTQNQDFISFS